MVSDFATPLQRAVEEGERGDWAAYVLRQPQRRRKSELRPMVAAALTGLDMPSLRLRTAVATIDADPQVTALAPLIEACENEDRDPADLLVQLFARKEALARRAGHAGYTELVLAAHRLSEATVMTELALAERVAGRHAASEAAESIGPLGSEADVCDRFFSFFAPLLDGVELHLDPDAAVLGMSSVLRWPDRIAVVIRCADPAAPVAERIASLGTTAHELGHVLQWRARASRGLGFLDYFSLTPVDEEAAAELGERLLFESELGRGLAPSPALWSKQRALGMLRLIGRSRFELRAYAVSLDRPQSLPALWAARADASEQLEWSYAGHGFYTDDPMRRYSYPLAYLRARRTLAKLPLPLTPHSIARVM